MPPFTPSSGPINASAAGLGKTGARAIALYENRPAKQWATGGALFALIIAYLLSNGSVVAHQPLNETWLVLLVCAQLTAVALWLLARPSVFIDIDPSTNELQVAQRMLLVRIQECHRVPLASVVAIARRDIETSDGCVYQAELACSDGARLAVSRRLTCQRQCEAVVTEVRQALSAYRPATQ